MGDGPQEWKWEEWVYYRPRWKGERRGVVQRGQRMLLPGWHAAGEASCAAETRRRREVGRKRSSGDGAECLSLKTRESESRQ